MAGDPDATASGAEQGEEHPGAPGGKAQEDKRPGRRHRFRWLCLCAAASASVMTLVLLLQLQQDLPLSFGGTLLLAGLAGLALPALFRIALGHRWPDKGLRPAYFWFGTCLVQIIALGIILVI